MSVNKFKPHVYVIPEDRADEQIANGFVLHDQVRQRQIQVLPCADGWSDVLHKFTTEYIQHLRKYPDGHLVMLIDFDGVYDDRRTRFEEAIPDDLKARVYVIGASHSPEELRRALSNSFEGIGKSLAEDCHAGTQKVWSHDQLKHNDPDRQRLVQAVRPFVF